MIVAISVVTGFQNEIRDKVIGFGSHIQINAYSDGEPINFRDVSFYPDLQDNPSIEHIQIYAIKAGILQNRGDTVWLDETKSDFKIDRDILGVMCKGIGNDFKWNFLENKIVEGERLDVSTDKASNDILISRYVANKLNLQVGEKLDLYFPKENSSPKRVFKIVGIYETGFEEYDKELVFVDIRHIQKLNDWGVSTFLNIRETCLHNRYVLDATCFGGAKNYRFDYGNGFEVPVNSDEHTSSITFCPFKDTVIRVIATDFAIVAPGTGEEPIPAYIPDTAWLHISTTVKNDSLPLCLCPHNDDFYMDITLDPNNPNVKTYDLPHISIRTELKTSGGSAQYYAGGFEVSVNNWDNLDESLSIVRQETRAIGNSTYRVNSIKDLKSDIFGWLDMLDMNVWIILVLTVFVAVINMSSALLVLILERTNMIGIIKAMGGQNWTIRKIFLYNAAYLIGKGMLWGNVIGIGLCLLQQQFDLVSLNQQTYYVSTVPVNLNVFHILLLNLGTITFCTLAMIVPSFIVTRISPVKAIKFN